MGKFISLSIVTLAASAALPLFQANAQTVAETSQMFTSCSHRFAVLVPVAAKPVERNFNYTTRTGASVPAREHLIQRGVDRLSVTVVEFPASDPRVDDAHVEHAAAALRQKGEVRFQAAAPYDPGMPGRQLNIFASGNRQIRASVYMADRRMFITEANAPVGDFPAMQFEQSITLIDGMGNDLDAPNGTTEPRNFGCR